MVKGLRASAGEHVRRTWRRWWAIVIGGVVGGALTVVNIVHPEHVTKTQTAPEFAWWIIVLVASAGVILSQFLAFHDVRVERDQARDEISKRDDLAQFDVVIQDVVAVLGTNDADEQGRYPCFVQFVSTLANMSDHPVRATIESDGYSVGEKWYFATNTVKALPNLLPPHEIAPHPSNALPLEGFSEERGSVPFHILKPGGAEIVVVFRRATGGPVYRAQYRFSYKWRVYQDAIKAEFALIGETEFGAADPAYSSSGSTAS